MHSGAILPWATSSFHNWINVPLTSSKHTETVSKRATVSMQSPTPTLRLSNNLLEEDRTCRKTNYIPKGEKTNTTHSGAAPCSTSIYLLQPELKSLISKAIFIFQKIHLKNQNNTNKAYIALPSPSFHNPTTLLIGLNPCSQSHTLFHSLFSFKPHTHGTCQAAFCQHFHWGDNPRKSQAYQSCS